MKTYGKNDKKGFSSGRGKKDTSKKSDKNTTSVKKTTKKDKSRLKKGK